MSIALQEAPANEKEQMQTAGEWANNFAINIATVNGSGSQTSNLVLLRALFKMGIPVNGKNLFPSNIQGLPTWYIIRLSKDGYEGRKDPYEVAVCMNGRTVAEDMANVAPGGIVIYDDSLPIAARRQDVTYYGVPVGQLIKAANLPYELRDYIANMVYVGVLAFLLGIEMREIEDAIAWNFGGKPKPIQLNMSMVRSAYGWAEQNLVKTDPYRVERMSGFNEGKVLIDGNAAAALGAVFGGVTVVAWYPITPASSVSDALGKYLPQLRTDPETGKANFAIIQAEDELAALGMVVGAGWAGARAMTSYLRPRPGPDGRVRRSGLLRRGARGDLGYPAHRPQHRPADAHRPGRYLDGVLPEPRRYPPRAAFPGRSEGVLRVRLGRVRPGGAAAGAGDGPQRS